MLLPWLLRGLHSEQGLVALNKTLASERQLDRPTRGTAWKGDHERGAPGRSTPGQRPPEQFGLTNDINERYQ